MALELADQILQSDPLEIRPKVAYNLNRWLESQDAPANWEEDGLVANLPEELQPVVRSVDLRALEFTPDDAYLLREALWLRDVASWAIQQKPDPEITGWLDEVRADIGAERAVQLGIAERLFDWTVRHIQLDPLPADPLAKPEGKTKKKKKKKDKDKILASRQGVPGPGYTFRPWQVMAYGHGDFWQRAWVFMLLARQQGIDVVLLAIDGDDTPPTPWLPAALLGDQLYLFDSQLGLPIPGSGGKGIGTLAQALGDPSILTALDVDNDRQYRVRPDELSRVVALVEASPSYLTRRMKLAESHLTGDQRIVLTTSPASLANRLRQCQPPIAETSIWPVAYHAVLYDLGRKDRLSTDRDTVLHYTQNEVPFEASHFLDLGRRQHLRGQFFDTAASAAADLNAAAAPSSRSEAKGAANLYLEARPANEALEQLANSQQSRTVFKQGEREADQQFRSRIALTRDALTRAKKNATYWIGLANADAGKDAVAIEWLKDRTLGGDPDGPWTHGAKYNLARIYERTGNIAEARNLYFRDDSPQADGNVLRARRLGRDSDQK